MRRDGATGFVATRVHSLGECGALSRSALDLRFCRVVYGESASTSSGKGPVKAYLTMASDRLKRLL